MGRLLKTGHHAWNGDGPLTRFQAGDGIHQADRIGMLRTVEYIRGQPFLHYLTGVHHGYAVTAFRHHCQVMGDQQDGQLFLLG